MATNRRNMCFAGAAAVAVGTTGVVLVCAKIASAGDCQKLPNCDVMMSDASDCRCQQCADGFLPMFDEGPSGSIGQYCGPVPSGCGVALTGDWPNPGAQFSEDYKFNLTAMMQSAQNFLGPDAPPLWRYDWRATEHPYSGPWTYLAMDWCSGTKGDTTGNNEHPRASGSSPGMLGWNEPNVPGQCEVSPNGDNTEAVQEYVTLARDFKSHGKFVVTPAPGGGSPWLDTFMHTCETLGFKDIDYMSFHHYVPCNSGKYGNVPFTTPDMMYASLKKEVTEHIAVMNKYNQRGWNMKGIWLTEVACAPDGGWGVSGNWRMDAADILMNQVLQIIHDYPQVTAWAWFPYRQFGMIWNDTSPTYELTDLGKKYFSNCQRPKTNKSETAEIFL